MLWHLRGPEGVSEVHRKRKRSPDAPEDDTSLISRSISFTPLALDLLAPFIVLPTTKRNPRRLLQTPITPHARSASPPAFAIILPVAVLALPPSIARTVTSIPLEGIVRMTDLQHCRRVLLSMGEDGRSGSVGVRVVVAECREVGGVKIAAIRWVLVGM